MCIAAWVWQDHPLYPLLLLLNRDEFHDRPTEPAGWWGESHQEILGGRDVLAGGTWMGCTRAGRVAFLTNVREPDRLPGAKTRGDLTLNFLESRKSPLDYAAEIVKEADQYNGFNLIVADLCSKIMVYVSNRPKGEPMSVELVSPGLHVLSNAKLDTPWYKAERLRMNLKELLRKHREEEEVVEAKEMVEKLMTDTAKADRESLPNTGCDPEWEFKLSPVFIDVDTKLGRYGTRSTAVLSVKTDGDVSLYEKYLEGSVWKELNVQYHIEEVQ